MQVFHQEEDGAKEIMLIRNAYFDPRRSSESKNPKIRILMGLQVNTGLQYLKNFDRAIFHNLLVDLVGSQANGLEGLVRK